MFRVYLFFLGWFIVGISLHLQIFPLDWTVADRWFYFPIIGLLGILGVIYNTFISSKKKNNIVLNILLIIILLLLSFRTIVRNTNWYDALTLYIHDRQVTENFDIENNIGGEYMMMMDYQNALKHYTRSVELFKSDVNLINLGYTYEELGDLQRAKKYYLLSFQEPNSLPMKQKHLIIIYYRLAEINIFLQDPNSAKKVITLGLREYPNDPQLLTDLALAEYTLHNYNQAEFFIKKAYLLQPTTQNNYFYNQIYSKYPIKIIKKDGSVITTIK